MGLYIPYKRDARLQPRCTTFTGVDDQRHGRIELARKDMGWSPSQFHSLVVFVCLTFVNEYELVASMMTIGDLSCRVGVRTSAAQTTPRQKIGP